MVKKISVFIVLVFGVTTVLQAQELQAKVTVNSQRVNNTIDRKIFNTLQTQLTNLLNTRKWTGDVYQAKEKIQCNFLVNIESMTEPNVYKAALVVQAARPTFNASYVTPLVNFQDAEFTFKYIEFQPVEFNENRVQGNDALVANITATFAYYVYLILGLDYDSFSPKGGSLYFQKMLNIVNNAPEAGSISGWRSFDGIRNRYWLADNLNNARYNLIHDIFYTYFRTGLDFMSEKPDDARKAVLEALTRFQSFNQDNPNTMVQQFFFTNRNVELAGIFKKANATDRQRASELLSRLDISNTAFYKQELK